MDDKTKTTGNRSINAIVLTVVGIVLLVLGVLIVTVHGAPLRGSGAGTMAIIAGVIVLVIAALRFRSRSARKDGETVKKP
jgi:uncharacterized YccA/Bax inhibitor family protein